MTWVKQSDTLWRDYKFTKLTDGAQALWHRANSWIADNLTDGAIAEEALKHLGSRKRYVTELEESGYWVRQPAGGWLAAGWQEIIRSKADVVASRSETKQRVSRYRNSVTNAVSNAAPDPDPVPKISSEKDQRSNALLMSQTARAYERQPLPPVPPELKPPPPEPWGVVVRLWAESCGITTLQLGSPSAFYVPARAVAAAAAHEAGSDHGAPFENAVRRLLGAWKADPYFKREGRENPSLWNLEKNLRRYALRSGPGLVRKRVEDMTDEECVAALAEANKRMAAGT